MKKKLSTIIALVVLIICVALIAAHFFTKHVEDQKVKDMAKGTSLLELYEKNHDITGWIRVPGTGIDYPVMNSDKYLHADTKGEYLYSGTPFVMTPWEETSSISMIYGHNMWVERTMFNPIHKYEKEGYWKDHQKAYFFVIRGKDTDNPYVERREYKIHAVALTSIKSDLYAIAAYEDGSESAEKLFEAANKESLFDMQVQQEKRNELVLCTCSYHISGDRSSGRILLFGNKLGTELKDICD